MYSYFPTLNNFKLINKITISAIALKKEASKVDYTTI